MAETVELTSDAAKSMMRLQTRTMTKAFCGRYEMMLAIIWSRRLDSTA